MTTNSSSSSPKLPWTPFAPAANVLLLAALAACAPQKPAEMRVAEATSKPVPLPAGEGSILRVQTAFDALVPMNARIQKVAGGFQKLTGLLFFPDSGRLWFSDPAENVVHQRTPEGEVTDILDLVDSPDGMVLDRDGNVLIAQRGARRIARRNRSGIVTTLVDRFEGKRLNEPSAIAISPAGAIYFTDPSPLGEGATSDLGFSGIYRMHGGRAHLVSRGVPRPVGLAFSPDGRYLFVANAGPEQRALHRFAVFDDGDLGTGREFATFSSGNEEGLPGGLQVDSQHNVWAAGPGGLWVFDREGKHLGTIKPNSQPTNCLFTDEGKTLWIASQSALYRITLN